MIKAGIFDIGGVLLRWTNLPLFEDVDQTLGITEEQRLRHWGRWMDLLEVGKISEEEFLTGFIADTQAKGQLPSDSLLQREFKKRFSLDKEIITLAHELKDQGLTLGIISNTISPHAEVMRQSPLFSGFDSVVLSHEVGWRKPQQEIYREALSQLHVKPEEAFFVDDLPVNIEGAEKVGIHGIVFQHKDQLIRDLQSLGVAV